MDERARARKLMGQLQRYFGKPVCPLHYKSPHELCIAVILSAQCTDERVNLTTPGLFAALPELTDLAAASLPEIEKLIRPTGFFKNKARHIKGFARSVIENHEGIIPDNMNELQQLPGVGRKTANVILQELYGRAEGVVVDTHVSRLAGVLKLSSASTPAGIERDLMELLPPRSWRDFSLLLIFLGRSHCKARSRNCGACPAAGLCPSRV